jgi:hypothetical protein
MIKYYIRRLFSALVPGIAAIENAQARLSFDLGQERVDRMLQNRRTFRRLKDAEVQVYSQWGEDGIIQYLIAELESTPSTFVEFGVENYREANTRFLLQRNAWRGLVIDGSSAHISFIKADSISWRGQLEAVCSFINKDNINAIIRNAGFVGEIGLLSVDIDGNDYWVLQAIDVVNPVIIVAEYNGLWGSERALTVPYDASFVRNRAHHSNLYYGASLPALVELCAQKGYDFVGSNSVGSNAFFIRRDRRGGIPVARVEDEYSFRSFREGRDEKGQLSFANKTGQLEAVSNLPLLDIRTGKTGTVKELVS